MMRTVPRLDAEGLLGSAFMFRWDVGLLRVSGFHRLLIDGPPLRLAEPSLRSRLDLSSDSRSSDPFTQQQQQHE